MRKIDLRFHHYDDQFFPVKPDRLSRYTDGMEDDTYWRVTIQPWKDDRTRLQNNAFHGPVLNAIMDVTGYERWEAKAEMKRLFAPKKTYINMDGDVVERPMKTSEMNIDQFSEFLEAVIRFAAQTLDTVIEIDPELRTSGLEPRIPDHQNTQPEWLEHHNLNK